MPELVVFAIDVGSTRRKKPSSPCQFGWARATATAGGSTVVGGDSIATLLGALEDDAARGRVVTLGIEAPLWIPVPIDDADLSTGRGTKPTHDADRSCFAPPGGYVALLALHQLAHLLGRLPKRWRITLDWERWDRSDDSAVLLWEAFVSKEAHSKEHERDAATAADLFLRTADALVNNVKPDGRPSLSLAGTALLWSRCASDPDVLRQTTLVVRPRVAYGGAIRRA